MYFIGDFRFYMVRQNVFEQQRREETINKDGWQTRRHEFDENITFPWTEIRWGQKEKAVHAALYFWFGPLAAQ